MENKIKDGASCKGCGLPNYQGLCPVCRGDKDAYDRELKFAFGEWYKEKEEDILPESII